MQSSQKTLNDRRVKALRIALALIDEEMRRKPYGDMNTESWEKHQSTGYEDAAAMLRDSHGKVMKLIESLSDEELFDKKHFSWTGTTNIDAYCISAAPSHYDWEMKKIKQYIKGKNTR